MTTSERACFVFMHLPSGAEVVCGRFVQEPIAGGGWRGRFVYARSYRERPDALAIDPLALPLEARTFEVVDTNGIFGALRDAAPDAWGRRVIEWKRGGGTLPSEIDYLLHSPEDRAGALSFAVTAQVVPTVQRYNRVLDLQRLLELAARIDDGSATSSETTPTRQVDQLLEPGTSMGGARPKNVVRTDEALWLAKFPMRGDRWNVNAVEGAMLALARLCGIKSAEHRVEHVGAKQVLLVKRFDRAPASAGLRRARMVSAKTVLRADDELTSRDTWSYLLLADELQRWVAQPEADRRELFRRAVFNALISNTDDHPRNHALIAPGTEWQLSPAYDLTPSPMVSSSRRDLAMQVGKLGRWANRTNLLSESRRFGFSAHEASSLIDTMKATINARWAECIRAEGGSRADVDAVAPAFDYPGFEHVP